MNPEDFKLKKAGEVRTRFAPSPTGFLHIGAARTALFNYLFAKKNQGIFVLRIENTDIKRSDPRFEKDSIESLKWLGIEWDEGPRTEEELTAGQVSYIGDYGPYRQSERLNIYKKYLEKLLDEDRAYYCFCEEEELEAQRQYQLSIGEAPRYSGKCEQLSKKEVQSYLDEGKPSVIRFRVLPKKVEFDDLIRSRLEFDAALIGDIVIAKNLTTPLYNFTCVIDDFEMKITHIIRGEDILSNTPKQILIQEALNFPRLKYAHLPLILGPDRAKLSKRHRAVAIAEYRKTGYLPESLINFMAFLGWNPGEEREIYSLPSLIKEFSIEKCQKGGAIFNIKRLDFLNGFYIRQRSIEKLTKMCLPYLFEAELIEDCKASTAIQPEEIPKRGNPETLKLIPELPEPKFRIKETGEIIGLDKLEKIVSLYQERLKNLSEISDLADFFFRDKLEYDKNLLRWGEMTDKEIRTSFDKLEKILFKIESTDWTKENLENILIPEAEKIGDRGKLLWPLRVALTGKEASAGPFEIAEILGKEKVLKRIKEARGLVQ
ncbi:MAG: glutamate--tRNA ligase [bacterium]|nr:glutamate--tRNA ligase [bacterium]